MTQLLPAALTSLDVALRLVMNGVSPVEPIDVSVSTSVGSVAAAVPPLRQGHPASSMAVSDGWALRALDTVGASSYSPVPLVMSPFWVEAGDCLPSDWDCVLDADLVEQVGRMCYVLAEAVPGHGIRRTGDDMAAGRSIVAPGERVTAFDLLVARATGFESMSVRSPRVSVIDIPSADGNTASSQFVLEFVKAAGARAVGLQAKGRDAASISAAIGGDAYDLIVTIGGTGVGRTDATIEALAARGAHVIHGLAQQPGRTAAVGKLDLMPVIAAPGAPDQAMAVCLMLVQPALDLLAQKPPRRVFMRPLARKISSSVGVAEVVLLETLNETWMPIAVGKLSLDAIARADAWFLVPGNSEGYAAGTTVGGFPLRDTM